MQLAKKFYIQTSQPKHSRIDFLLLNIYFCFLDSFTSYDLLSFLISGFYFILSLNIV